MLKIFICPQCYNFRIVSRKPDATCFHCGSSLNKCNLEYIEYMNMSEEERISFKEDYKKRMKLYKDKLDHMLQDKPLNDRT
ncbi:hypothetical protein H0486_08100 [Lachnospiraceae bacterium MD1]|uniref:DNA-directed RNA polymerase subunit M n=1 Tax=Variimorphobacter saccharofermentans TaxID=2755051 RepID=A0A839JYT7_9FIRM|nr:hypothetical protein [Variimorphobacter saccharofermentans]MBB2182835.1 hypothetical protein [Variimorphobacter saccharofermentans]